MVSRPGFRAAWKSACYKWGPIRDILGEESPHCYKWGPGQRNCLPEDNRPMDHCLPEDNRPKNCLPEDNRLKDKEDKQPTRGWTTVRRRGQPTAEGNRRPPYIKWGFVSTTTVSRTTVPRSRTT